MMNWKDRTEKKFLNHMLKIERLVPIEYFGIMALEKGRSQFLKFVRIHNLKVTYAVKSVKCHTTLVDNKGRIFPIRCIDAPLV